ncbi:MAG TPA: N-acetylmuramoyl-L-alanine amidase [Limnochordales bacterium]|nr:N-acetylmuramoyl-L-alanine amidase [Limnochordales bacterium]
MATILLLLLMLFAGIPSGAPEDLPPAPAPPGPGSSQEPADPSSPRAPQEAPYGDSSPPSGAPPVQGSPQDGPLSGYTIVLDPGHGGRDPGAVGVSGRTWEKYNTWFVALDAKALLEGAGARVVLTRTGDVYVPLPERVATARRHGAALFVSIHNDWNPQPALRGVTTYYWHEASRALAEAMQAALVGRLGARNVGVLRQPFYVLRMADVPAVLVELGFLSNGEDEALLAQPAYRYRAAEAIYQGVLRYLTGA